MTPLLFGAAAFLTFALPTLAVVVMLSRRGAAATSRLASVERLRQELMADAGGGMNAATRPLTAASAARGRGLGVTGLLQQTRAGRRLLARSERDLEFTPWTVTPSTYVFRRVLVALLAGCAVWLVFRSPLGFLGGAVAAHFLAGRVVARQEGLYRQKIGRQTEDVIDILVAHLRAGQSLVQCLVALTEEAPEPSRDEYGRVARQVALGAPVSEALRSLERRIPVTPVSLLISALNMHHRIGGDLPMLLRIAADTVHDQVRLQDELSTAAAGQMLAAYVVVALPIMLFALLYIIDRPYISGLLQPGWNLLLVVAGVMEITGFLIMRSFTRIEL
jgi:tight adherence protein B